MSAETWDAMQARIDMAHRRRSYDEWVEHQRLEDDEVTPLLERMGDTTIPVQLAACVLKHHLRAVVPVDFEWRMEISSSLEYTLRFRSRLLADAPWHRVSDCDFSIMLLLLDAENWDQWRSELQSLVAAPGSEGEGKCNKAGRPDSPPAEGGTGLPDGLLQPSLQHAAPAASRY